MASQIPPSSRLDKALVARGFARSREEAVELILGSNVRVNGAIADKASRLIKRADTLLVASTAPHFVGRGARKLIGALEELHFDAGGLNFCDLGSSTGGFTQALIERGANIVVAIDVGRGQMSERIATHPKVVLMEGVNARNLERTTHDLPEIDVVVGDLSFISLNKFTDVVLRVLLEYKGRFLLLVKPQFELDRVTVSKGRGIVREPADWQRAIAGVAQKYCDAGAVIWEVLVSQLKGSSGNQEFFLYGGIGIDDAPNVVLDLDDLIARAVSDAQDHQSEFSP